MTVTQSDETVFAMLDRQREAGTMNMMGTPRLLQDHGFSREDSLRLFQAWIDRFEDDDDGDA